MSLGVAERKQSSVGPKLLVLLVGSNPLPNYLAACALRPARIVLVYSKETEAAKDRLRSELGKALGEEVMFDEACVQDATCATEVRRVFDSLLAEDGAQDVHLNYTGGTKVMAAHARIAFRKANGAPRHASYLDEGGKDRQPCLRFDDGNPKPLSHYPNIPLSLQTLLALHGITHKPREARTPAPTIEDAGGILHKVLTDLPLAAALYCERERLQELGNPNKAISEPFRAERYGLSLSLPELPTNEQLNQFKSAKEKKSWFEQWYKFIGGEWLEEWMGEQLRLLASELGIDAERDITVGVNAERIGRQKDDPTMEIDIGLIRGHRSYLISCTTDTTKRLCKSKLFEIAVRSRQLGGDLARAALVCLADDPTVSALQADIDDVWGASNTTRVFGISDVRAWSDCDGKEPNRHSLKAWLES